MDNLPWFEIAIALTQAFIALNLLWLTRKHHSTQLRVQRALRVHEWGNECVDVFAEAERFCLLDPAEVGDRDYEEQKDKLLNRSSALIDRGRMFFRNKDPDEYGQEKPRAYRGYRPAILDPLVAAYLAIAELDDSVSCPDLRRNNRLWDWRREFVSILQQEIHDEWLKDATKYSGMAGGGAGLSIRADSVAPSAPMSRQRDG